MPTEPGDDPAPALAPACPGCGLRPVKVFPPGKPGRLCSACYLAEWRARRPAADAAVERRWKDRHPGYWRAPAYLARHPGTPRPKRRGKARRATQAAPGAPGRRSGTP